MDPLKDVNEPVIPPDLLKLARTLDLELRRQPDGSVLVWDPEYEEAQCRYGNFDALRAWLEENG